MQEIVWESPPGTYHLEGPFCPDDVCADRYQRTITMSNAETYKEVQYG